jgi:UDP-glucose 4-epimerase
MRGVHVLVTGGCGYIGSHTVVELLGAGHRVTVVDSLVNSSAVSLRRVEELTGASVGFAEFDLRDRDRLDALFASSGFDAVIHFAGLKAVGESVAEPRRYYDNNLGSTLALTGAMAAHGVRRLVFSSSATVYGDPPVVPIPESSPLAPTNPYGQTKAMIEQILGDMAAAGDGWDVTLLRYFNPIGAHPSGEMGEDPNGIPNNLLPFVAQVAVGRRSHLSVFGDDYDTPDGTGVRDYIHVVDLARGHLAALEHGSAGGASAGGGSVGGGSAGGGSAVAINLGTGTGVSVLDVVRAFEAAARRPIPYQVAPRRPGDIAACYAEVSLAHQLLGWKAERSLDDACRDTWRWQSQHPNGYR